MILRSLFNQGYIGLLKLKNRIVFPPMATALCNPGGFVSQQLIDYHVARAKGGCGLSIVEISGVHPTSMGDGKFGLGIYDDKFIPGLTELARAIKNAGGVPAIQLWHAGRQINSKDVLSGCIVAPSPISCPICNEIPRQLDINQIKEIIESFGDAAARAKTAGFEAVEIHGAHGYLICQFLSSYSNKRDDRYGGVLEKRANFAVEILKDIRNKTSAYFPIIFRLSAEEFVDGGINILETMQIVKILERNGADAIHVSAGNYQSLHYIVPPMEVAEAFNAERSGAIKQEINIPVILAGRINDPLLADRIISEGIADFVSIGRGQLADPDFSFKASRDNFSSIIKCIACNQGCFDRVFYEKKQISCLLNAEVGREQMFSFYSHASSFNREENSGKIYLKKQDIFHRIPKKILIAGAGPAGLTAAFILSNGFKVILCEKSNTVGGQFNLGSLAPDKETISAVMPSMRVRAEKYGVEIRFQTEVDKSVVERMSPDIVIIATGALPVIPDIPFIINEQYVPGTKNILSEIVKLSTFSSDKELIIPVTSHDVLLGNVSVKENVAIIGGGVTGVETAEFLAKQGKKIVVIEMTDTVGEELSPLRKYFMYEKIRKSDIKIYTGSRCTGIGKDFIEIIKDGYKIRLGKIESLVFACGVTSRKDLLEELKDSKYPFYIIGDALKTANAIEAISSAAETSKVIFDRFASND